MNQLVPNIIECLRDTNDLELICETLESLTYSVWSRNQQFIDCFIQEGGVEAVINLIRPRALSRLSEIDLETIELRLFQGKDRIRVTDNWVCVIRGLALKFVSDFLRSHPSYLNEFLESYPWFIERLYALMDSASLVLKYGAFCALEVICWQASQRKVIDLRHVITHLISTIQQSCDMNCRLISGIRWRVAHWRVAFDLLHTLAIAPDLDLSGGRLPVRLDWRVISADGRLVISLCSILKFCSASLPAVGDVQSGTVFSGPGIFKDSGMQVHDLAPFISSTIFILQRICVMDEVSKKTLMLQLDLIDNLKSLANFYGDDLKEEIIKFLIFMGLGNPISQRGCSWLLELLKSSAPRDCFKALRILSNPINLLDGDQLSVLIYEGYGIQLLYSFINTSMMNVSFQSKVGHLKLQRHPDRTAIEINPNTSWKNVLKSFAMYALGELCLSGSTKVMQTIERDCQWLSESALVSLKSGCELEKWGTTHFLSGLMTHGSLDKFEYLKVNYQMLTFLCVKLLALTVSSTPKYSLLLNPANYQWKYECQTDAVKIIKIIAREYIKNQDTRSLSGLHQAGLLPTILKTLSDVAEEHDQEQLFRKYCHDNTLPLLVSELFETLYLFAMNDKVSRDILCWEDSLRTLSQYTNFACDDVKSNIIEIIECLVAHLRSETEVITVRQACLKSLKQLGRQLNRDQELWPEQLVPKRPENLLQQRNLIAQSLKYSPIDNEDSLDDLSSEMAYLRLSEPMLFVKICNNPTCNNKESRFNQFKCFSESEDLWFCSKVCAHKLIKPKHLSVEQPKKAKPFSKDFLKKIILI